MKCIDMSRYRRIQYEKHHSEHELLCIDFDVFGYPIRIERKFQHVEDQRPLRERIGDEAADMLIINQPELARRLGLFNDATLVQLENSNV